MNFCSWPNKFRPTELRGSKREVLIFYFSFLFLSLTLWVFFLLPVENLLIFCPPLIFLSFSFYLSNLILKFGDMAQYRAMCTLLIRVRFWPEIIYLVSVQVQFILNELYLSYFLTPEILIKISSLGITRRPLPPKIVKKIRLSRNSTKILWVTRFR